jgi:hypothetical protein
MTNFSYALPPISVLAFLGTGFVLAICVLVALYAALSRSKRLFMFVSGFGSLVALVYMGILLGFSLVSREVDLSVGERKYFCEIDCHVSYSVVRVWMPKNVGGEQSSSKRRFVLVELRTWFDPSTISPTRGNGPYTPNDRIAVLTDAGGHALEVSPRVKEVLAAEQLHSTPFSTALRPGEAYTSYLVFEVPEGARDLKLWLGSGNTVEALLWANERSPWHKKALFLLGPSADAARSSL